MKIPHTCNLNHIVGLPIVFIGRVITQIPSVDNSHHAVLVYNKPCRCYDKHRMINLLTYSQCQTGLINTGL